MGALVSHGSAVAVVILSQRRTTPPMSKAWRSVDLSLLPPFLLSSWAAWLQLLSSKQDKGIVCFSSDLTFVSNQSGIKDRKSLDFCRFRFMDILVNPHCCISK